ncbi:hypothetical protein CLU79DRAFT_519134 [Phycomyces nitens]|nr:hypothetical protein CLU79DRAFT_519134 [Phycomyces nitens]
MGSRMTKKKQAAISRASLMYPILESDDLSISEFESDSDDTSLDHVQKSLEKAHSTKEIIKDSSDSEMVDQFDHKIQSPKVSLVRQRPIKDDGSRTLKRPRYTKDIGDESLGYSTEVEDVPQESMNVDYEQSESKEILGDFHATFADDISEFSDTNVLDGLDDWKPTASNHKTLSQTGSMLSIRSFDSQVDREEEFIEETVFRPVYPHPITNRQVRRIKDTKPLTLEPGGLASQAREVALDEAKDFMKWERSIKATMAHHGSVTWAVSHSKEARLFRMTDTWSENGVIFSWCVPVTDEEQESLRHLTQSQPDDDSVDEIFSQPQLLPPYIPSEDDDKYLFGFFFLHSNTTPLVKERFLKETFVGIWPPWTHYIDKLSDSEERKVFMATRFMANSMY